MVRILAVAACAAFLTTGCGGTAGSAVDRDRSTLVASPGAAVPDGASTVTLTATARDATGAALSGKQAVFSAPGAGLSLSSASATTNAAGEAAVGLTSSQPGQFIVSVTVDGVLLGALPTVTFFTLDISHVLASPQPSPLPAAWRRGPFMEIYVRGYKDSNGDGVGDFKGLTQSLDYLADLGVTGLWLMPVNRSQDHDHGYAVVDHRALEDDYGTQADFDELLRQAHARGIGVIVDYVMNHSAAQNPLFTASASSPAGPFRSWYVWQAAHPAGWSVFGGDPWRQAASGWYYAPFWDQMPDFNLLSADVVEYHHDNLRLWLNRGVDGFRFDAVGVLVENGPTQWSDQPQNYQLMADIRTLAAGYDQRFLVCEDPDGAAAAFGACGAAFAFPHNRDLMTAARGNPNAVALVGSYFLNLAPEITQQRATFLANHDSFTGGRVQDQLSGNQAQYQLAAATYLLQPGTPFIYYGEELGMAGAATLAGDASIRTPMSWTGDTTNGGFSTRAPFRALSANVATNNVAAEKGQPGSLHTWYKSLIALRRALPSLAAGAYEQPVFSGTLLSFRRSLGTEHSVVVINYGAAPATPTVTVPLAGTTLKARFPAGGADVVADGSGQAALNVPAQGVLVYTYTQ